MAYIENPKTRGSGIVCCIPQTGECPNRCKDCFFQSGRSYLEPLSENLPNMPPVDTNCVVRVNDGNDSNVNREKVIADTAQYPHRFFNTAIPKHLEEFPAPVVLTVNPGDQTDASPVLLKEIPPNLMYVRFRANMWNCRQCDAVVAHYCKQQVPVVLTFMAYHELESIPHHYRDGYSFRKRTLNPYWAITHAAWKSVMAAYEKEPLVHSCGTENVPGGSACKNCGNCLREYFATTARFANASAIGVQMSSNEANVLTDEQKDSIYDTAYSCIYEDCLQNWDYLKGIIKSYLDTMTTQEQAEAISSDPAIVIELLGFDPATGKTVDPEASFTEFQKG